jgi:hypothetical protein
MRVHFRMSCLKGKASTFMRCAYVSPGHRPTPRVLQNFICRDIVPPIPRIINPSLTRVDLFSGRRRRDVPRIGDDPLRVNPGI